MENSNIVEVPSQSLLPQKDNKKLNVIMVKTQKVKVKKITLKDAKLKAAKMGLEVNSKYDKRCLNTWLYTIGEPNVIPVERKQLVHIAKKKVESLSMSELIALAETIK